MGRKKIPLLIGLMLFQNVAAAQTFPPGSFRVAGTPAGCGAVWTVVTANVGDVARATPASYNQPATIWIDHSFYQLPVPVQYFIYGHECAHHVLGSDENAADCWSAKVGRSQGWFTDVSMQFLTHSFAWNPGDWTHAPGWVRLQNIYNCYTSP
ncbi:hypothetical protein KY495_05395 [Massilia sp. PAMC28688]|uniref:hypothetical protein n=1 Tax=Massilia sp. PAMC28688 TaxID=2861283 RepID=UPI001C635672|nr:hypothetical protein [Massilia sp. PAMC28688]QYF94632.1 hypothetical protein KY495_05395 [Massilia sp. PAMC28688]